MSDKHKREIDIIQQFNAIYGKIVKMLRDMCHGKKYIGMKKLTKLKIDMTFDTYLRLIKEDPQFALTEFGPMIFANRLKIMDNDDQYFLTKNYNLFMMTMCNKYDFDYSYCMELIELSKEVYVKAESVKKSEFIRHVQNLLTLYSQHEVLKME
jgi:hypothetical protein